MCEILSVKAEPVVENPEEFVQGAMDTLYESNNDGFGMVAVGIDPETETFELEGFKGGGGNHGPEPFVEWLKEQGDAWRIVVHARLATAGGIGFEQTHPIKIIDDDVDTRFVVHNGIVRNATNERRKLKKDGHEFNTTVDSEVIAHVHDNLPDTLDDFEQSDLRGRLNYLLFGKDRILVRNSGKYTLTDDLLMTCRPKWLRENGEVSDIDLGQTFALYKPTTDEDGNPTVELETTEVESNVIYTTTMNGVSAGSRWGGYGASSRQSRSQRRSTTSSSSSSTGSSSSSSTGSSSSSSTGSSDYLGFVIAPDDGTEYDPIEYADMMVAEGGEIEYTRTGETDDGLYISLRENSARSTDNLVVAVCDGLKEGTASPVEGATVVVTHTDTGAKTKYTPEETAKDLRDEAIEYEGVGTHTTDRYGRIALPNVEHRCYLSAYLVELPDDSTESDKSEGDSGVVELTASEARRVEWWYDYGDVDHEYDGYCSMHNHEYTGHTCESCCRAFKREELLDEDTPKEPPTAWM